MKEVFHAIFSLEFTQAVILFVLGACSLLLEPVLLSLGVKIEPFPAVLFTGAGCGMCCWALFSFFQFGPALAYLKSRKVIDDGVKFIREWENALEKETVSCPHAKGANGESYTCPVWAAFYKNYKGRHEGGEQPTGQ